MRLHIWRVDWLTEGDRKMARRNLKPVSIAGIEFDALVTEKKTMSATIPAYPVESGFPVSDTIILDPITLEMTLYISDTPVTWLYRHGSSVNRVKQICDRLEDLWFSKELVKIVTTDAIYKNMGIKSMTISKSREIGYAREVAITAQMVRVTERRMVLIPSYVLKSGETGANAGTASTSDQSAKSSSSESSSSSSGSDAKKKKSILYGIADGMNLIK